jgi:hypothetical protein
MGTVYVYSLGGSGIYKVGHTKDLEKRQGTYETISTERLVLHAQIETPSQTEVEKFIKHRLQSRRWLGGQGRELYEVGETELDDVIAAARRWNSDVLPKLGEAKKLANQQSDGRVLMPSDIERGLHRELMRLRQVELTAAQERQRIETELKILMQTASRLDGIATWKNKTTTTFDIERLKRERRELHDAYYTKITISRPFEVRW